MQTRIFRKYFKMNMINPVLFGLNLSGETKAKYSFKKINCSGRSLYSLCSRQGYIKRRSTHCFTCEESKSALEWSGKSLLFGKWGGWAPARQEDEMPWKCLQEIVIFLKHFIPINFELCVNLSRFFLSKGKEVMMNFQRVLEEKV